MHGFGISSRLGSRALARVYCWKTCEIDLLLGSNDTTWRNTFVWDQAGNPVGASAESRLRT